MNLSTFNVLVRYLEPQEVFHNNFSSCQKQMPVDCQILLTLLSMGCYGNSTSLNKIAAIVRVGNDFVNHTCFQVMTNIQRNNLRIDYLKWLRDEAKETAKQWVENQLEISAWTNRFYMVDGTLIFLYRKPSHYCKIFYYQKF